MFSSLMVVLFRIFRLVFSLSKDINDQTWLQKIYVSRIFGKAFVKLFSSFNVGSIIYTFTSDGHVIPTSSLMDYEYKTMVAFTPSLGDVVVDVGAYVGRYALNASKKVGAAGVVIAIEPDLKAYKLLVHNLALSGSKNIIPFNIALSKYNGVCKLYRCKPGFTSLEKESLKRHPPSGVVGNKPSSVECRTLDSLLAELDINRVNWIKVDVEGAEHEVLQGMIKTIEKNEQVKLIFEIHHMDGVDKVKPQLRKMNFKISYLDYMHILACKNADSCS